MISAGDFRNGITFEMDGNVVQVIEFQHVKPGKGAAFVRTKYKNVITGAVVERSFNIFINRSQSIRVHGFQIFSIGIQPFAGTKIHSISSQGR